MNQTTPQEHGEETAGAVAETPVVEEAQEEQDGGDSLKYVFLVIGVLVAIVLLTTACWVVVALASPDGAANVGIIRDIFIIILGWFSIFIGAAIVILILQLAALFNLIKNEMIPILDDLRKTSSTVRGTTSFMSQNLAKPVIRATGFFAYIRVFLEYLRIIRRAELPEDFVKDPPETKQTKNHQEQQT